MSINLITDGWLYPIRRVHTVTAPDANGTYDPLPVTPCDPVGTPSNQPPAVPTLVEAMGPEVPVSPCGASAVDPTIDPPTVPEGQEGSEVAGTEAPAIPKCPGGEEE
jgi:hypothetical protein